MQMGLLKGPGIREYGYDNGFDEGEHECYWKRQEHYWVDQG